MANDDGDFGIDLEQYNPEWMEDGLGIRGEQDPSGGDVDLGVDDLTAVDLGMEDAGGTGGAGGLTVTDGTTTVTGVTTLNFDGSLFTVSDEGSGTAGITLKTTSCA